MRDFLTGGEAGARRLVVVLVGGAFGAVALVEAVARVGVAVEVVGQRAAALLAEAVGGARQRSRGLSPPPRESGLPAGARAHRVYMLRPTCNTPQPSAFTVPIIVVQ